MTRANGKPVLRLVDGGRYGPLVVAVRADTLTIKARGGRWAGPSCFALTWAQLYLRSANLSAEAKLAAKRATKPCRKVRRGILGRA